MKINVMHIKRHLQDENLDETLISVDDETLITVTGFGSGEYRWRVEPLDKPLAEYDPQAICEESILGKMPANGWDSTGLGQAAVWYTPLTFAHCVMDFMRNQ